jgi:hypothetical protein
MSEADEAADGADAEAILLDAGVFSDLLRGGSRAAPWLALVAVATPWFPSSPLASSRRGPNPQLGGRPVETISPPGSAPR